MPTLYNMLYMTLHKRHSLIDNLTGSRIARFSIRNAFLERSQKLR